MRRRDLLAGAVALAASGLSGCVSGPGGSDGTTTEPDTTTTTSDTTTTAAPPELADRSVSTTDAGCGQGTDRATVTADGQRVVVSGTIRAPDPCHVVEFAGAAYDADADELAVTVEVVATDEMCTQCVADVSYEATLSFDGGLPGSVVVRHATGEETTTIVDKSL